MVFFFVFGHMLTWLYQPRLGWHRAMPGDDDLLVAALAVGWEHKALDVATGLRALPGLRCPGHRLLVLGAPDGPSCDHAAGDVQASFPDRGMP
jgi:hypothetical protein